MHAVLEREHDRFDTAWQALVADHQRHGQCAACPPKWSRTTCFVLRCETAPTPARNRAAMQ